MPTVGQENKITSSTQMGADVVLTGNIKDGEIKDADISASAAITRSKLANVSATSRVIGRKTAGAGADEELTLSDILDFIGSATKGDILVRDTSGWARLAAGAAGLALVSQGAGALPSYGAVSPKIDVTTTDVTSTANPVDIYTVAIPANTLGTSGGIKGRLVFEWTSNSVAAKTVALKYGGTTIGTISMTPDAITATIQRGVIDFMILAKGATNSQEGSILLIGNINDVFRTAGVTNFIPTFGYVIGTAAVDSTAAQNLVITIGQQVSNADSFTLRHAYVEQI